jgi:putative ABC transport system ATP-binding protein
MIEARDLRVTYSNGDTSYEAVRGVTLNVAKGEFVSVVGPSGCGKSTLLYTMGGMLKPTSGDVRLGGTSLVGLDDRGLSHIRNERVGFVFQAFNLVPILSVLENVVLPAAIARRDSVAQRERAQMLLDLVGLDPDERRLPHQLSGGEQQRVAIARALMMEPEVILADEPTGNLDTPNSRNVVSVFRRLHDEGQTIVLVTHDLGIAPVADRVAEMRDGTIVLEEDFGTGDRARITEGSAVDDGTDPRAAGRW